MSLVDRLHSTEPLIAVELRPPKAGLSYEQSIDTWIGMYHGIKRLAQRDTVVFLTDNAVGESEEEGLHHHITNLSRDVSRDRFVPFLTCKHSLEYCLWYADRAVEAGCEALTVVGGDASDEVPRCVPHAFDLRQQIRTRIPDLKFGGWANPYRDAKEQVGYITDSKFTADFVLTQIVSHHDLEPVQRFLDELKAQDVDIPILFGVFYYRSGNPKTLNKLNQFFNVPVDAILADFKRGMTSVDITAQTIQALREIGADKVYLSNLALNEAARRHKDIEGLL